MKRYTLSEIVITELNGNGEIRGKGQYVVYEVPETEWNNPNQFSDDSLIIFCKINRKDGSLRIIDQGTSKSKIYFDCRPRKIQFQVVSVKMGVIYFTCPLDPVGNQELDPVELNPANVGPDFIHIMRHLHDHGMLNTETFLTYR